MMKKHLPLGLFLASAASVSSIAYAATTDAAHLPPPPIADPLVAWVVQAVLHLGLAAAVPPLAWLCLKMAILAAQATGATLRAAAAFIRSHVARTPSKADDAAGNAMADDLVKLADRIDEDAAKKRAER